MRLFFTFFLFVLTTSTFSQSTYLNFSGQVRDRQTNEPVGFVKVHSKATGRTIITNVNGEFEFYEISATDTVIFSCVGYERKYLIIENLSEIPEPVYLKQKENMLNNVEIFASDQPYLAKILASVKKKTTKKVIPSKVYYELKSFHDDQQIELLQGFYNADIKGYDIQDLSYKIGRVGLQYFNERIFVSLQTSLSIVLMEMLEVSNLFPNQPLQYGKSKIMKKFDLKLVDKYAEESDTMFVISFKPRVSEKSNFYGKIWVTEVGNRVSKVEFNIEDASKHPFIPIFPDDTIHSVDLNITRTFEDVNNQQFWDKTYFNYAINYQSREGEPFSIFAEAVLYAYESENQYYIPDFQFPEVVHDYRKISAFPYNDFFWNEVAKNQVILDDGEQEAYYNDSLTLTMDEVFFNKKLKHNKFYYSPYVPWTGKRVLWRDLSQEQEENNNGISYRSTISTVHTYSKEYNLEVQLYFDIVDSADGMVQVSSATIFDPFYSYMNLEITPKELCFINIFFDLVEVERRKMMVKINQSDRKKETVLAIYAAAKEKIEENSKDYFGEVFHGHNEEKMKRWNAKVSEELGIDNINIFEPYTKE